MRHAVIRHLIPILALFATGQAAAQDVARGAEVFADHCAVCHGMSGKGDGPMAETLTVPLPDLTRLAAEAGGTFPMLRVVYRIDGRDEILAHGGPMPLFGEILAGESGVIDAADGAAIFTTAAIVDVVAFLQAIQVDPDSLP